ncbi:MAG: hypothetical protein VX589_04240 [Myxococcota bacterium]|nr:hypothetical protein [Myxococcota bacterium]
MNVRIDPPCPDEPAGGNVRRLVTRARFKVRAVWMAILVAYTPAALAEVNVKVVDASAQFQLETRYVNDWTERWDLVLPGVGPDQFIVFSRHQRLLKTMRVAEDGRIDVQRAYETFGHDDFVSATVGDFGDSRLVFYHRTQGALYFYGVTNRGAVYFTRTTSVGRNVEGLVAGQWTGSAHDDLVLYDKFAGTLRLFEHRSRQVRPFRNNSFFSHVTRTEYSLHLRSESDFLMNAEKLITGNFDGDQITDILAYNEDTGEGTFFEFNQHGELQLLFTRDDLPVTEGAVVVVGQFDVGTRNGDRDDLLFYSRACPTTDGTCEQPSQASGCELDYVESCVCARDPYCCTHRWDQLCAREVDEFQCNAVFTCQGVGRILYDELPDPDNHGSVLSRVFQVLTNGAYDGYRWRKTVAKLNRKWTHALALTDPASGDRSRLFFYSNRKTIPLTPIITKRSRTDQSANISASAMRELLHQLNRSFLPAGVEFEWDGQFYYLNDRDVAGYRCGRATQQLKDRTHQWADWIANSSCRACLFEVDPYCRDEEFDLVCATRMNHQCAQACPTFSPETPERAPQDSIAIILRNGGTSCSSHTSRYIIYGGWRRDTTYTGVDGQPTDRFGAPANEGAQDFNLKRLLHEMGHYFALCHTHQGWPAAHHDARRLDLDGRARTWPRVYDTPPSPHFREIDHLRDTYCSDQPMDFESSSGVPFTINPDPSQPMGYGNMCGGLLRFSHEQIQVIRRSLHADYTGHSDRFGGKSFLFHGSH